MTPTVRAIAAACALAVAGDGLLGAPAAAQAVDSPSSRATGAAARRGQAPPIATWLDTAALHARLAELQPVADAPRLARVVRVFYDSTGRLFSVTAPAPHLMPAGLDSILPSLVRATARALDARDGAWWAFLEMTPGASPAIAMVQLDEEGPRLASDVRFRIGLQRLIDDWPTTYPEFAGREVRLRLGLEVERDGAVGRVTVVVSSGTPALDAAVRQLVTEQRFHPGRLDGEAIRMRAVLPVRFVFADDIDGGATTRR